jgi:hypothetical protein
LSPSDGRSLRRNSLLCYELEKSGKWKNRRDRRKVTSNPTCDSSCFDSVIVVVNPDKTAAYVNDLWRAPDSRDIGLPCLSARSQNPVNRGFHSRQATVIGRHPAGVLVSENVKSMPSGMHRFALAAKQARLSCTVRCKRKTPAFITRYWRCEAGVSFGCDHQGP